MSVVYGAGGHGQDIAAWTGWQLVDDNPALGFPAVLPDGTRYVSGINDPHARFDFVLGPRSGRLRPDTAISGVAYIGPGCDFRAGTVIFPNVTLIRDVECGYHVHINSGVFATRTTIGNFTTISPGAQIGGDVTIGERCAIGAGAAIRNLVTICDDVTIGAGAVVVRDITEPGTYVGVPCGRL